MMAKARVSVGYFVARRLMRIRALVKFPSVWRWMEGQFARKAALGSIEAQRFYGHILLHRGQGLGAKQEGVRLLRLAATAGDARSAYQLGVLALATDIHQAADANQAIHWWGLAAEQGHALAAKRLAELYRGDMTPDAALAAHYDARAKALGL